MKVIDYDYKTISVRLTDRETGIVVCALHAVRRTNRGEAGRLALAKVLETGLRERTSDV